MTLYRCFAWEAGAGDHDVDGPLWVPRRFQGEGRHDNPDVYGCLYLADRPLACVVEQLAPVRGQRLLASMLMRRGLPLALARVELPQQATVVDLDNPTILKRERLRPSLVGTRQRAVTQPQALALYRKYPEAAGIRWWSAWEAQWANCTVFDRAERLLRVVDVQPLTITHPATQEAADWFGLRAV